MANDDASNDSKSGRMVGGGEQPEDNALDRALRPKKLDDLIGQDKIRDNLRTMIHAAKARGEALDHVLIYGPPGLGKCIAGESLVLSSVGIRPMSEFAPGDLEAQSFMSLAVTVQGSNGPEQTSHVYANGRTSTIRIRTRSGFELEGTPNHPVLIATPNGPTWKRLDALTTLDFVAIARDTQLWGATQHIGFQPTLLPSPDRPVAVADPVNDFGAALQVGRFPSELTTAIASGNDDEIHRNFAPVVTDMRLGLDQSNGRRVKCQIDAYDIGIERPRHHSQVPSVLNADLAYLMGLLIGDGQLENGATGSSWAIMSTDFEIRREVMRICDEQFGWQPPIHTDGASAPHLRFNQNFGCLMHHLGMCAVFESETSIPGSVLQSDVTVIRGFLQGLFDADGHPGQTEGQIDYCTKSRRLAHQVQVVLANLGIIAHRTARQVKGQMYWQLLIGGRDAVLFYGRVGFRLSRKQSCAQEVVTLGHDWSQRDIVPFAHILLAELFDAAQPHKHDVHQRFSDILVGDQVLTRTDIRALLQLLPTDIETGSAFRTLHRLSAPSYYWDAVAEIDPGEAKVFDFVIPGTHSFTANGFINHNTTLSHVIGNEMDAAVRVTSGPAIERAGDLAAILTNLRVNDILFIDEIHRLNRAVEEVLYPAMEDYALDIVIGKGPSARSVRLKLPPISIIGATTRLALMTAPLRARFGATFRVDFYPVEAIEKIVSRAAHLLNTPIDPDALNEVAKRSRGTPRVALRMLRRVRDFAQVKSDGRVTAALARDALNLLEVDPLGLDDLDRRVLRSIIEKFNGGPVGLETIAASISEEGDTIMDVVEPYLLQLGFLDRTPRGRTATQRAYEHLGFSFTPPAQPSLL